MTIAVLHFTGKITQTLISATTNLSQAVKQVFSFKTNLHTDSQLNATEESGVEKLILRARTRGSPAGLTFISEYEVSVGMAFAMIIAHNVVLREISDFVFQPLMIDFEIKFCLVL